MVSRVTTSRVTGSAACAGALVTCYWEPCLCGSAGHVLLGALVSGHVLLGALVTCYWERCLSTS